MRQLLIKIGLVFLLLALLLALAWPAIRTAIAKNREAATARSSPTAHGGGRE